MHELMLYLEDILLLLKADYDKSMIDLRSYQKLQKRLEQAIKIARKIPEPSPEPESEEDDGSFVGVEWTDDDIVNVLADHDIETAENDPIIDKVKEKCLQDDRMSKELIDAGWKVLDEIVEELKTEKGSV